ncbi:MAG: protein-export chaperone SecB [Gammaproteobacteria bacterium]|nr:protein-export chaperone SecB [Gammaproteobacteria bacterium]
MSDNNKQVVLQKIYLKDASLEVPGAPAVFTRPWQPQVDVQIGTALQALAPEQHQVTLTVTVTVKLDKDVAFLVEVHQSGVFLVKGVADAKERQAVLGAYCPGILFPFAREAVADLVQRGGFPQLLLQPVNFDALYQEHVAKNQAPPEAVRAH